MVHFHWKQKTWLKFIWLTWNSNPCANIFLMKREKSSSSLIVVAFCSTWRRSSILSNCFCELVHNQTEKLCGASLVTRVYLRRTRWGKDCNTNEMQSTDRVNPIYTTAKKNVVKRSAEFYEGLHAQIGSEVQYFPRNHKIFFEAVNFSCFWLTGCGSCCLKVEVNKWRFLEVLFYKRELAYGSSNCSWLICGYKATFATGKSYNASNVFTTNTGKTKCWRYKVDS